MATSLMNDSAYAYDIHSNLIAMAEIIFVDNYSDLKDMLMDNEDIDLMLENNHLSHHNRQQAI